LLALSPRAHPAADVPVQRVELVADSADGCPGIPFPRARRELVLNGEAAVDTAARFWELDRPAAYAQGHASRRYRIGEGVLVVDADLSPGLDLEVVRISVAEPISSEFLATYLPGTRLPCERITRYTTRRRESARADLAALARFDAALQEATELLYDADFAEGEMRLREAIGLRPDDSAPYWMMARLRYLALEGRAATLARSERIAGYEEAERWADEAVARAPGRAEGYLWQAIAHGRIATSAGSVNLAVRGWLGGRGPRWLEETMRKAVSLPEDFRFFGFSTRADALHALAQFYRLAPTDWYMRLVGTRGNLDRAIELSREAVALQPVRIEYRKELAVELLCRNTDGDAGEARTQLEALNAIPAITPLDRIDQRHAGELVDAPAAKVCGYSRDWFQEAVT
jgi:tetratricopeptide (TPR) repeat protein